VRTVQTKKNLNRVIIGAEVMSGSGKLMSLRGPVMAGWGIEAKKTLETGVHHSHRGRKNKTKT